MNDTLRPSGTAGYHGGIGSGNSPVDPKMPKITENLIMLEDYLADLIKVTNVLVKKLEPLLAGTTTDSENKVQEDIPTFNLSSRIKSNAIKIRRVREKIATMLDTLEI